MDNHKDKIAHAPRKVFREEIRSAIRDAIFSGQLKPGDRVTEIYWARQLGVSQGPVREAIRDLEANGLIESVPFKGAHVRKLSVKDIKDNYSVRICLEMKSVKDAIVVISDEQVEELAENLIHMELVAKENDLRAFTEIDAMFHRKIIKITDNPVLLTMWEQCNIRNWTSVAALEDADNLKRLLASHKYILDAIRKRDSSEAISAIENHLQQMMERFIEEIE